MFEWIIILIFLNIFRYYSFNRIKFGIYFLWKFKIFLSNKGMIIGLFFLMFLSKGGVIKSI